MKPAVLRFILAVSLVAASVAPRAQTAAPAPATDLDAFMSRVLQRRDDNWKKLQQYVLDERETFQLIGPGATPLYGVRRESTWFPRDGRFIKSPLRINGVTIGEEDRRKAEAPGSSARNSARSAWRRAPNATARESGSRAPHRSPKTASAQALEPGFVSAAYFLRFKFDPGHYALAGREQFEGRDVPQDRVLPVEPVQRRTHASEQGAAQARRRDSGQDEQGRAGHALG